jgi:hypothetical protein
MFFSNNPTGNVSMHFRAANLEFEATSLTLLVTESDKATVRGTGTINGQGSYAFLATGFDGKNTNTQDTVRFQIKNSSGTVIYDSQPGDADTAPPIRLVTGQVVIH